MMLCCKKNYVDLQWPMVYDYFMEDFVECKICGWKGKQISTGHLGMHKIKIKEYKLRFPDAELTCESTKIKLSISAKNRLPQTKETIERIRLSMRKVYASPDFELHRIHSSGKFIGSGNPFYRKKHTEETKNRLSCLTRERLLNEYRTGKRVSPLSYLGNGKGMSRFEKIVNELLILYGFIYNYKIPFKLGCYTVDFALLKNKLGIELDSKLHLKSKIRDMRKDLYLSGLGWKIIRIFLENNISRINLISKILRVLNENKIYKKTIGRYDSLRSSDK